LGWKGWERAKREGTSICQAGKTESRPPSLGRTAPGKSCQIILCGKFSFDRKRGRTATGIITGSHCRKSGISDEPTRFAL